MGIWLFLRRRQIYCPWMLPHSKDGGLGGPQATQSLPTANHMQKPYRKIGVLILPGSVVVPPVLALPSLEACHAESSLSETKF
jgi:hypothetical protein